MYVNTLELKCHWTVPSTWLTRVELWAWCGCSVLTRPKCIQQRKYRIEFNEFMFNNNKNWEKNITSVYLVWLLRGFLRFLIANLSLYHLWCLLCPFWMNHAGDEMRKIANKIWICVAPLQICKTKFGKQNLANIQHHLYTIETRSNLSHQKIVQ